MIYCVDYYYFFVFSFSPFKKRRKKLRNYSHKIG